MLGRRIEEGGRRPSTSPAWKREQAPVNLVDVSERTAVRAVFVDAIGAVLLMRITEPHSGQDWWITPGGGVEAGELPLAALHRETAEELGVDLARFSTPKAIWHRRVVFSWAGSDVNQHETFYLINCDRFDPPKCEDGDGGYSIAAEPRWWTTDQLRASSENIAPDFLAVLLNGLDRERLPQTPQDITV
jgi:8-oxo-dGTP pyrophosphatase MutT (NUDIX family)